MSASSAPDRSTATKHLQIGESADETIDPPVDGRIDCSVLMPAYNEEAHIEASVAAMLAQRFEGTLEFLVVDGGSTDRTVELVRELARRDPRIRLLHNPRGVTPSGLNVALGHARGRWVARMDAHTEYPEDYLKLGVERLACGGTRWVSGLALARGRGRVSRAVGLALRGPLGRGGSRKWVAQHGPGQEYELDSGVFAGVWERATLLEYGGWDEHWARNQDSEMAGRFLARGDQLILIPAMAAEYAPRDSLPSLARQYFSNTATAGRGRPLATRTRCAARICSHPESWSRWSRRRRRSASAAPSGSCRSVRLRRGARGMPASGRSLTPSSPRTPRWCRRHSRRCTSAMARRCAGGGRPQRSAAGGARRGTRVRTHGPRLAPAPSEVYAPSLGRRLAARARSRLSAELPEDLGDRQSDDPQIQP